MKHLLLSIITLWSAVATAQTDMTHRIANPSFETGNFDGWTNDGMTAQGNTSFPLKAGRVYAEKWTDKGNGAPDAALAQTVTGLPAGTYTVSVVAQNIQQDAPAVAQQGVTLQANGDKTAIGVAGKYSVTTTAPDGTIDIAFTLQGATGNYVCVDNFTLTLDKCDIAQLAAMIDKAEPLATAPMNAAVRGNLAAALAAAKAQTGDDGLTKVVADLDDATIAAQASMADYAALKAALDDANTYLATSPANGVDELKSVIDDKQSAYDAGSLDDTECAAAAKALAAAVLTCRVANATGAAPKVTSEHFMPVGCNAALGRMTATGASIAERGYVWATHPHPTVADNRSTVKYDNNGDIYELSPLDAATEYYVRAYAMTKSYAVAYGEEQRIYTLPQATCRWSYDEAGDAATNDRIRSAVRDACEFYNTWTSIPGFHLNAHYVPGAGAGGGTADCSYGGYMRVSQSVSYQRTGTLLHESNHGVGVGTSSRWKNWDGSGLRTDGDRGDWLGWRATQMVQFFDHNTTGTLHGDGTHMWPYGINGAHEDDNRKISYIANALITHAVHQDGLAAVEGIGASPAYTFEHEDGKSYFITNEDPDCNANGQAYLYETSTGLLKWGEASASELTDDSQFAWQFEYVPDKAYYRIRNAKSGKYFTYTGATIKTATKSKPGATENFQLMIGYPEITIGLDKKVTKRGYWIQAGTGNFQPYTLTATATKGTKGEQLGYFSPLKASKQRWLILTADEARPLAGASAQEHVARLRQLIDGAKAMTAVPHTDIDENATATLQALIAAMEDKAETMTGIAEAKDAVADTKAAIRTFINGAYPTDIEQPYDISCLIDEQDFATTDSWSANDQAVPTFTDGVGETGGTKFKFTQTLADMPVGVYRLNVQAFHRPETIEQTYEHWLAGADNAKTLIYCSSTAYKTTVANIMAGATGTPLSTADTPVGSQHVPTDAQSAAAHFAHGLYDNCVVHKSSKRDDLVIGIANTSTKFAEGDWTAFTNFRLHFYGNDVTKAQVQAVGIGDITASPATTPHADTIHDLTGRRLTAPAGKGIYIINGKKYIKR